ncbi:MAG TPA: hypothetical protein VIK11_13515 [Tepidiformaceae bacterium]
MSQVSSPRLSGPAIEDLRRRFPYHQDERWVAEQAREAGSWVDANRGFLAWHRERGVAEMKALMEVAGIARVASAQQAADLVALAYEVFMPPDEYRGTVVRVDDTRIRIVVGVCPMFEKIERAEWHGVTACGSWHHRRGWYDAMDADPVDSLLAEQKWGDAACIAEVAF